MTASRNGTMYNSFNDIFNEYNFIVDSIFLSYFETSDDYLKFSQRMEAAHHNLDQVDYEELANNNTVLIMLCDIAEYLLYAKKDRRQFQANALKFYYLLPDRMYSFFEKLVLSINTPFYEELQRYSEIVFESGIRQYWICQSQSTGYVSGCFCTFNVLLLSYLYTFTDKNGVELPIQHELLIQAITLTMMNSLNLLRLITVIFHFN